MSEWKHAREGKYELRDGKFEAMIFQKGELWVNLVYYDGGLVDAGEWCGRGAAFRNANRAIRNGIALRHPIATAEREEEDDD